MKTNNKKMLALAAVVIVVMCINGCGSPAVVPTSYQTFSHKDGSFKIDYPAEWEADSGGRSGYTWARFTSGSAAIKVDSSVAGSLMADITGRGRSVTVSPGGEDLTPVAAVHEKERGGFEEEAGVKEEKPVIVTTGLPDARQSQFSGTKTFGGSIKGYRVTALTANNRIRVVCECPESEWEVLKPAFDKAIASLGKGKPQL